MDPGALIFETDRLVVRTARDCDEDVAHLLALWNDPAVMTYVGFPQRMQEAVGGRRVGEGRVEPAPEQRERMTAVPYFIYEVSREEWKARRA